MSKRKKLVWGVLLLLLAALALGGCGEPVDAPDDDAEEVDEAAVDELQSIGIVQLVEHPALDAAREGFISSLEAEGFVEGENIEINYQNAQGDQATAQSIAEGFVADDVDLMLAIATPAAQAAATVTQDIPVLITAVTDPVAAELAESLEEPGTNVTGTNDMNPIEEQLELVMEIAPEAENVGIMYNPGEVNSVVQVDIANELAPEMGINLVEATATNTDEVSTAAESLVGQVEAIYVPTDNTVVDAIQSVIRVAEDNNIPLIAGESESVESGALATVGINYYTLGEQTGRIAAEVLQGADPATTPIEGSEEHNYAVNLQAAENMGVELPEDLLDRAEDTFEE